MEWDRRVTRAQLVQGGARAAIAGSLLGGVDLLSRAGDAFAAGGAANDVRHFVSRPDLTPPKLTVHHHGQTAPGDLFLAPSSGPGQRGLLIADSEGEPVWFHPTTPQTAMNFRTGTYHGKPVLTWWEGKATSGLGTGTHVILDDRYRVIARVPAGGGRQSDLHEFLITPENTALLTSYEVRRRRSDLGRRPAERQGDRRDRAGDRVAERPRALRVASLDHVDDHRDARAAGRAIHSTTSTSTRSTSPPTAGCSCRRATRGPSTRSAAAPAKCAGGSAARRATSRWGKGTVFAWQHDARHQGHNRITIFDDGAHAAGRAAVARPRDRARSEDAQRAARAQVRPSSEPDRVALHGEHAGARQRQRDDRLGQRAVPHRVRPERRDRARRASAGRRPELPRVPAPVARAAVAAARGRLSLRAWAGHGLRLVERRDRGRCVAARRRGRSQAALRAGDAVARHGFETALRTTPRRQVRRVRWRSTRRATCSAARRRCAI